MYKYLLFDLDETLLDFKKAEATAITAVLKKHGISADESTVRLYSKINDTCWKRYERGEITRNDIYTDRFVILGETLGVKLNVEAFSKDYFLALSKQGQTLSGSVALLDRLRAKGYKMAAITNGALIVQTGRIVISGIGGFFSEGIYISEQVGFKKPQPEYFEFVLKSIGNPPKDSVLVLGDSPSSDIKGALSAGLDCCFINLSGAALPKGVNPTYTVTSLEDIPLIFE